MSNTLITCLAAVHFTAMAFLVLYGLHRLWFLVLWRKIRQKESSAPPLSLKKIGHPHVTIQLPFFNERFVAGRLIDAACMIEWPRDRMDIQVLDDSDDDTRKIVDDKVAYWKGQGASIRVIRRENRTGFKAGALAVGLSEAKGEFIAVFDADFVPTRDFLIRIMPGFTRQEVGMIQGCWGFVNSRYSWLTAVQSILVGHHFDIEHRVRFENGFFFNFNGTAGVWRKSCITSAGGWQSDTVTEDLDLSYRAQIKGWEFSYCHECRVPSELPVTMASFRRQQQRWASGSTQTALKILPKLLFSRISPARKREAVFHLMANLCWLAGFIAIITLYPTLVFRMDIGPRQMLCLDVPVFLASGGAILFYFFCYARWQGLNTLKYVIMIPLLSMGLSPSIATSILKNGFRRGGVFERTPKFGVDDTQDGGNVHTFYHLKTGPSLILNGSLMIYTALPLWFAWQRETWPAIPFLVLFPLGFLVVFLQDLKESMPGGGAVTRPKDTESLSKA